MTWFMLAMIAYPEAQRKCQEELDRVIGRSRMPIVREQLPVGIYLCYRPRIAPLAEFYPYW